jgi:YfiH family protein
MGSGRAAVKLSTMSVDARRMPFALDTAGFYRPDTFSRIPWLFAGFGTRMATAPAAGLATVHQVHSADAIHVERPGPAGTGDALITNTPGVLLAVKTADCIPLLMVDFSRRAIAAVHAGWRGTAQRIGPMAIDAMKNAFGTRPEDLYVAIGPGIGPCCYEVGPEVARAFPGHGGKRTHLNLPAINRQQLEQSGVPANRIEEAGLCTFCHAGEFFSFRREREQAGRMLSIIGVAA